MITINVMSASVIIKVYTLISTLLDSTVCALGCLSVSAVSEEFFVVAIKCS